MEDVVDFRSAVLAVGRGQPSGAVAEKLLSLLGVDEQLSLLDGDSTFWAGLADLYSGRYLREPFVHGEIKRLGIPGIRYCDGPRGVTINHATAFPVATARAATWDLALEERVGLALGLEARVHGANTVGSVCINLPRHPAWGRVQETYGEDPVLLGEFGAAHLRGLQKHVMGCVKHFALNSMETARFRVDVRIDDAALHEVYLPHFKRCVEQGAMSVMSAYNSVNGEWAGENRALLTDILRKRWGFDGFVISDWVFGLRDGVKSVKAGLDIEAPFQNLRARTVGRALASGELDWASIAVLCRRILDTQLRHYATRIPAEPGPELVCGRQHRDLAREVAERAIVLLKNDPVAGQPLLPLAPTVRSCAVIGAHADAQVTGDEASSWVDCPETVSPFHGLREALPEVRIDLSNTRSIPDAVSAASKADAALVIVGYDGGDEGEFLKPSRQKDPGAFAIFPPTDGSPSSQQARPGPAAQGTIGAAAPRPDRSKRDFDARPTGGDRRSVRLRPDDVELIRAVAKANPRTVVSIRTAGAVIIEEWRAAVAAILVGWYSGCEGGRALAGVLTGRVNPSGRLPWSMPTSEAHLPAFDAGASAVTYDKWFGQRLLDRLGVRAAYPLGYGLSYTEFRLRDATVDGRHARSRGHLKVAVTVANVGGRSGRCVVQIYARPRFAAGEGRDFPSRVLLGFASVDVDRGASRSVHVAPSVAPLRQWRGGRLVLDVNEVDVDVAQHAGDPGALTTTCSLLAAHV